jgi:acyl carrier protein
MVQAATNLEEDYDFEIKEETLEDYKRLHEMCKIALDKMHFRKKKHDDGK